MTDTELLELAAKAAGITPSNDFQDWKHEGVLYHDWNPLTDDGDALRLAVKLKMEIDLGLHVAKTYHATSWMDADGENDPYAATRRAIVRAAAEIGKEME